MSTRRNKYFRNKSHKAINIQSRGKKTTTRKHLVTALAAATRTLKKTCSIKAAKKSLKKQALYNARRLFGSIGN